MAVYAVGNMLLKLEGARLPRAVRAGWPSTVLALAAVLLGLTGNVLLDPAYVRVFGIYFAGAIAVIGLMFLRVQILTLLLALTRLVVEVVHVYAVEKDTEELHVHRHPGWPLPAPHQAAGRVVEVDRDPGRAPGDPGLRPGRAHAWARLRIAPQPSQRQQAPCQRRLVPQ